MSRGFCNVFIRGLSFLIIFFIFTTCDNGNDDNSIPKDPEGTIELAVWSGSTFICPWGMGRCFWIEGDNNFYGSGYSEFVSIGSVKGLSSITKIPQSGWAERVAVKPGYGYVVRQHYDNFSSYVRLYVVDYITSATNGGVIGFNIKYQGPFEP